MISSSLQFQSFQSMDGEINTVGHSFNTQTTLGKIHILVVDDDSTCLSIVASMLRTWRYEVVTTKHPVDALSTLRVKQGLFDLVVTDVHMPDMNGFELQRRVDEEFKLPVVMMSADDKESAILRGLEGGAAFYIVKPVTLDDFKNLWQYAVANKKGKSVVIEETGSFRGASLAEKESYQDIESALSVNDVEKRRKKDSKRKASRKVSNEREEDKDNSITTKKAKVVWTTALHNRFLQAIKQISLEKAVPKKILEFMSVPGLTRENVASHLQKYRIFLKRVSDSVTLTLPKSLTDKTLRSSFASGHPPLMANNTPQGYQQFPEQQQMGISFQPDQFGGNIPVVNAPNLGPVCFPNQEPSSSNAIPQVGYGQSRLLSNQVNLQQPTFGNTNSLYQPNNVRAHLSLCGDISSDPMNSTNQMQVYQQQTHEVRPEIMIPGLLDNFSTYEVRGPNYIPNIGNMGFFNDSIPIPDFSHTNNNNYVGDQMISGGEIVESSQMGSIRGEILNGFNGSYGLMNGIPNGNMTVAPMGNGNSGYLAQGMSFSAGFDSAIQVSPTFTDLLQQENALAPPQHQTYLGNGELNDMFDLINNSSTLDNISLQQHFGESDFNELFLKQVNDESLNQQQGGEELNPDFSIASYHVEVNPLGMEQSLDQQQGDEEVTGPVSGYQMDDFFPWFDQYQPNQAGNEDSTDSWFGDGTH